jgi:hypothetical protein
VINFSSSIALEVFSWLHKFHRVCQPKRFERLEQASPLTSALCLKPHAYLFP